MSATHIDMKFSATVEKDEQMPAWIIALSATTGKTCDELVEIMLTNEMYTAGQAFVAKFPELFRGGLA